MARSAEETRSRLISTAEELFALRGLESVSLNEITKAARQRNASALHYHFGGKEGLLEAILEKHQPAIDDERQRMLSELAARDDASLRELVEVLVLPLVAKLDDGDGGTAYVRLMAQLIGSPAHGFLDRTARDTRAGGDRLMKTISDRLTGLSRASRRMRTLLVISLLFHGLSDFARLRAAKLVAGTHRNVFVASLVDGLVGILAAEEPQ